MDRLEIQIPSSKSFQPPAADLFRAVDRKNFRRDRLYVQDSKAGEGETKGLNMPLPLGVVAETRRRARTRDPD
jgi:hypothetical protein